jgi:hypothetical protein
VVLADPPEANQAVGAPFANAGVMAGAVVVVQQSNDVPFFLQARRAVAAGAVAVVICVAAEVPAGYRVPGLTVQEKAAHAVELAEAVGDGDGGDGDNGGDGAAVDMLGVPVVVVDAEAGGMIMSAAAGAPPGAVRLHFVTEGEGPEGPEGPDAPNVEGGEDGGGGIVGEAVAAALVPALGGDASVDDDGGNEDEYGGAGGGLDDREAYIDASMVDGGVGMDDAPNASFGLLDDSSIDGIANESSLLLDDPPSSNIGCSSTPIRRPPLGASFLSASSTATSTSTPATTSSHAGRRVGRQGSSRARAAFGPRTLKPSVSTMDGDGEDSEDLLRSGRTANLVLAEAFTCSPLPGNGEDARRCDVVGSSAQAAQRAMEKQVCTKMMNRIL